MMKDPIVFMAFIITIILIGCYVVTVAIDKPDATLQVGLGCAIGYWFGYTTRKLTPDEKK